MIKEFFNAVFGFLSAEWLFVFGFVAISAAFSVCLFISVFKTGYGLKKRVWYLIIVAFFCALLKARANFSGEDFTPILLSFGLLLFIPIYFIRVKAKREVDDDAARRDFVRFLDSKIKQGDKIHAFNKTDTMRTPVGEPDAILKTAPKVQEVSGNIDFSHVKNVLKRLEPASLSYSDRRQIHDLELLLYEAENGENAPELKSKINEGLGNLLKIMSKHGV